MGLNSYRRDCLKGLQNTYSNHNLYLSLHKGSKQIKLKSLDQSMLGNHDNNISVFVLTWLTSNIILKSTQVDFGEELKCWVYWALLFICQWPIASLYFDICMQLSKKLGLDIQMEVQESQHSSWHLQDYTGNQFCVQK